MLSETEFARLIVSWKNQFGEEIRGKNCVPFEGRTEMYRHLIKTLTELHGYTQEDFEGKTYRMVMEASINPNSPKADGWRAAATADWYRALDTFFPQTILAHESKESPSKKKFYVAPEDDPRLKTDNPIDMSIFADMPKPSSVEDEDFLKLLESVGNE